MVDGVVLTPSGQTGIVQTIWIIDKGETWPRLVTAYPKTMAKEHDRVVLAVDVPAEVCGVRHEY